MHYSIRIGILLTLVGVLSGLIGCKSELKDPHLIDPIYIDLSKEQTLFENLVKKEEKNYAAATIEYKNSAVGDLERKIQAREMEKANQKLTKYRQMAEYYRIKAELRRAYAKKEYRQAFEKGEEWPPRGDAKAYFVNKNLRLVPKRWSARVPGSPHFDEDRFAKKERDTQDNQPAH
jgi:hypothetical protein